jgi:hypothetical protein
MAKKGAAPVAVVLPIPDADSVARFCAPINLENGRPTGAVFQLRPQDQDRLSCTWVECVSGAPTAEQQAAVRGRLSGVGGYDAAGRIALLNVGAVRALIVEMQKLDVLHWPSKKNTCHSAITGVGGVLELTFAELLADLAAENLIDA